MPPNEGAHYVLQHVQQHFYEPYRPYKTEPSEAPLMQIPSHPYPSTFAPDYENSSQPADQTYQTSCEPYPQYSSARSSVDYSMYADQNPDYIIGTSSMRYTASSPPNQDCVSPAMVSDGSPRGYVQVSELPPSPPVYDLTPQTNVCDPRAVSDFEEPTQGTTPNLPTKRSPSGSPSPIVSFADDHRLEAGSSTPHVQQETEVYSSGESELDREEYEGVKEIQTATTLEQPDSMAPEASEFAVLPSVSESTSISTSGPTNVPVEAIHEARTPLTITVPPRPKRRRGQAGPVPVPNLTKKSRGRSVPTVPDRFIPYGAYKAQRSFVCVVADCRKCFARGEHLKRHVRSIHTNEKREPNLLLPITRTGRPMDADLTPCNQPFRARSRVAIRRSAATTTSANTCAFTSTRDKGVLV